MKKLEHLIKKEELDKEEGKWEEFHKILEPYFTANKKNSNLSF